MGEVRPGNTPKSAETLIRMLGLPFNESLRIEEALTHRSASHERGRKKPIPNYERLEFLGDRVVGLIVSEYLLNMWPQATEGEVGQVFSTIVSTQTLASIARRMDLGSYMILGKGSHSSGERENHSLLADTFESLAAAIYCEYGLETARQVLIPWFAQPLQEILRSLEAAPPREPRRPPVTPEPEAPRSRERGRNPPNYKLLLQKWAQQHFGETAEVRLIEESGPSHQKRFVMGVFLGELLLEQATAGTKRGAGFAAMENLWQKIEDGFMPDLPQRSLPKEPTARETSPTETGEALPQEIPASAESHDLLPDSSSLPVLTFVSEKNNREEEKAVET
ncbi:MAG: Ribonuclease III [Leptospirillum sp. Group IV 'UBA BS']|nr:MAG: Ribonuclease III [Leptospirillum sp. Group IV 'UBA BS']